MNASVVENAPYVLVEYVDRRNTTAGNLLRHRQGAGRRVILSGRELFPSSMLMQPLSVGSSYSIVALIDEAATAQEWLVCTKVQFYGHRLASSRKKSKKNRLLPAEKQEVPKLMI